MIAGSVTGGRYLRKRVREIVVDGDELEYLETCASPFGCRDDDFVALFFVEDGAADRRRGGDHALFGVGVFGHHQLVLHLLVASRGS